MTETVTPFVAKERPLSLALCFLLYGPWLGVAAYRGERRATRDHEPDGSTAANVVSFRQGARP